MRVNEVKQMLRKNDCYFYRQGSRHEIWISRKTGKNFKYRGTEHMTFPQEP